MDRFVPVKELQRLLQQKEALYDIINKYPPMHCKICGDTQPKHGFYPLLGMTVGPNFYQTSAFLCNRCGRTDENYLETFGEPKEKI